MKKIVTRVELWWVQDKDGNYWSFDFDQKPIKNERLGIWRIPFLSIRESYQEKLQVHTYSLNTWLGDNQSVWPKWDDNEPLHVSILRTTFEKERIDELRINSIPEVPQFKIEISDNGGFYYKTLTPHARRRWLKNIKSRKITKK